MICILYIGAWRWLYNKSKHVACTVRKYNKYWCVERSIIDFIIDICISVPRERVRSTKMARLHDGTAIRSYVKKIEQLVPKLSVARDKETWKDRHMKGCGETTRQCPVSEQGGLQYTPIHHSKTVKLKVKQLIWRLQNMLWLGITAICHSTHIHFQILRSEVPQSANDCTTTDRQPMYVERNIETHWCNHCCSGKAISVPYSECVCL